MDNGEFKILPSIHLCPTIGSISESISPWKTLLIFSFEMCSLFRLFPYFLSSVVGTQSLKPAN